MIEIRPVIHTEVVDGGVFECTFIHFIAVVAIIICDNRRQSNKEKNRKKLEGIHFLNREVFQCERNGKEILFGTKRSYQNSWSLFFWGRFIENKDKDKEKAFQSSFGFALAIFKWEIKWVD